MQSIAREERGIDADIELVKNPRRGESMVEVFDMDTIAARERLWWELEKTVENSVRGLRSDAKVTDRKTP